MKKERVIMVGEVKETSMSNVVNVENKDSTIKGKNEQANKPEKSKVKNNISRAQRPESERAKTDTDNKGTESLGSKEKETARQLAGAFADARRVFNKELKPEEEEKLREIKINVEENGIKVEKTGLDVMNDTYNAFGEVLKTGKWSEESLEAISTLNKLVEWFETDEGKKFNESLGAKSLSDLWFADIWGDGNRDEGKEFYKSLIDEAKNIKPGDSADLDVLSKIIGPDSFSNWKDFFASVIPAPESKGGGTGGAVPERTQTGPGGGEVTPAPEGVGKGGSPESPNKPPSEEAVKKIIDEIKKEKRRKGRITRASVGSFILFSLILGIAVQGLYARFIEQAAERFRSG